MTEDQLEYSVDTTSEKLLRFFVERFLPDYNCHRDYDELVKTKTSLGSIIDQLMRRHANAEVRHVKWPEYKIIVRGDHAVEFKLKYHDYFN